MSLLPEPDHLLGLLAAALIVGLGAFVLAARPDSWLHRVFFVFTLVDGGSTAAFEVRDIATDETVRLYAMYLYFALYIVLVAMLYGFGILFPRPLRPRKLAIGLTAASSGGAALVLAAYLMDYRLFWRAYRTAEGGVRFSYETAGLLVIAALVAAIGALVIRLTRVFLSEPSSSHRQQAGFVLGGIVLGFAPLATTGFANAITTPGGYLAGTWDVTIVRVLYAVVLLSLLAAGWLIATSERRAGPEGRMVLGSLAGVTLLTLLVLAFPGGSMLNGAQSLALTAYPILLGFAIVRYNVLGIEPTLRRTAVISLAALTLTAIFILAEEGIENVLADTLLANGGDLSGWAAALAAAALSVPIFRVARRAVAKLAPELDDAGVDQRRIEVYRHALFGALDDGIVEPRELRTLIRLRESLGVTEAEHDQLLATWRQESGAGAA